MEKAINTKKTKNPFKLIPWWGWVGSLVFFLCHPLLYLLTSNIVKLYGQGFVLSWCPKINGVDDNMPFVPYFFAQMYYISYAVFFIVPIVVSLAGKKYFINFMLSGMSTYIITACIFLGFPSWQDRQADGLFELIEGIKTPFTKWMMGVIVGNDGGNMAWNMAPSYHILSALFNALGTLRKKQIHVSFRISNYILSLIVIPTVLFVRQHYIIDVFMALAIGCLFYIIFMTCDPAKKILEKHPNFLEIKHKKKGK